MPLRGNSPSAPRPVEKKKCSAGRSAQAQTSCRRRGKAGDPLRQSGTETPGPWGDLWPGEVWDTSSFSFRYRWPVVDESCSIELTQQLLHSPGQRVAKRNARKEELVKCVLAPRPKTHHPPRDGSADFAEENSVPEGQAKSEQAPIRRPPSRGGPLHRSAPNAFLFGPCTARFSFGTTKEKWGVHSGWTSPPPAGAETRWPPSGGPSLFRECRTQFSSAARCAPADSPW